MTYYFPLLKCIDRIHKIPQNDPNTYNEIWKVSKDDSNLPSHMLYPKKYWLNTV